MLAEIISAAEFLDSACMEVDEREVLCSVMIRPHICPGDVPWGWDDHG